MAINDLGHRAISLTGSQAGIVTDTSHTKARILDVRADRIRDALDEDLIVLVAGFQGVSTAQRRDDARPRRLGHHRGRARRRDRTPRCARSTPTWPASSAPTRGSSRTPASCRSSPSRRCSRCRRPAPACCSCARSSTRATTACASTAGPRSPRTPGTFVVGEEETMERPLITAVTHSRDEARITLLGVPDHPGVAGRIFTALADANVNVDMIIQDEPDDRGRGGRHVASPSRARTCATARAALDPVVAEVGIARGRRGPGDGQGLGRRRRHEVAPGRRRAASSPRSATRASTSR